MRLSAVELWKATPNITTMLQILAITSSALLFHWTFFKTDSTIAFESFVKCLISSSEMYYGRIWISADCQIHPKSDIFTRKFLLFCDMGTEKLIRYIRVLLYVYFVTVILGDALGGQSYWLAGAHIYTPLPFRPGKGGFGDCFRTHVFANAGSLDSFSMSMYNSSLHSSQAFHQIFSFYEERSDFSWKRLLKTE